MLDATELRPGARVVGNETHFTVWAPRAERLDLHLVAPFDRLVAMERGDRGYYTASVEGIGPGARYFYRIGGDDRPDPASRFQPLGVHGPSEVVGDDFEWSDGAWRGIALRDYVIYEFHVGTFTPEGTFDAAIAQLTRLRDLGITAVEVMPVAQFPGDRNWGYDGVYPNAVQNSYGGPDGLRRFVDAAHARGLAVILDVVYNHLGPEGNYFGLFGPYFTSTYQTPWGEAMNFDGPDSDEVRRYFSNNALQWMREYHIDALRLDAVHAIIDRSARPFLQELARQVHQLAREIGLPRYLIAESDLNDPRLILPENVGGFGLDAQWADDFHHAMHVALTNETRGYYADFKGFDDLPAILENGWLYAGQYSEHRRRRYGAPPSGVRYEQLVFCLQNHDQVGNRMAGDRLASHLDPQTLEIATGLLLMAPALPMLFMGEEYAETAPFQYFTSHGDPDLVEAVRKGRREEFASFEWEGEVPDPDAVSTFERSKLDPTRRGEEGARFEAYVRELLTLRRRLYGEREPRITAGVSNSNCIWFMADAGEHRVVVAANFGSREVRLEIEGDMASWDVLFPSDSAHAAAQTLPAGACTVAPKSLLVLEGRG